MAIRRDVNSERHVFTTDVPGEIAKKLLDISRREDRSVSRTIKMLITEALEQRERQVAHA